jgi:D-alanyl-D-alanine carboxypeptidase (penicillin-binding protein 5/6)/beta-lactamase class A
MFRSALVVLLLLCPAGLRADEMTVAERVAPLIKAHAGKVAVAIKNLETGETFFHNADEVMPTASLIKVAVLVEAYLQADAGSITLRDRVTMRDDDKVPGSGLLSKHFSDGASFPLRDALRLMVAVSDNTATNLVLDKVGIASVNRRMADWGLKETRINAKVFRGSTTSVDPERTRKYGLGSTTAREMVSLFEQIGGSDRLRPALKQAVLGHLRANEDAEKFRRFLPPDVVVAHKDGAVNDARTDAGIIYTPAGPVAVCVLTTQNEDRVWRRDNAGSVLCARVAQQVWEHYRTPRGSLP